MEINLATIDFNPGQGGGEAVINSLSVTSNGVYRVPQGVDGYNPVTVNVPAPEFVTETLSVSVNGTYNPGQGVDGYSQVTVDVHPLNSFSGTYTSNGSYSITGEFNGGEITVSVPAQEFVTESLSVTSNGTYNPGAGIDGYSQVTVNVPEQKVEETFTVTPSIVMQTVTPTAGRVFSGGTVAAVTASIDSNILPENIKSGVEILGVEGTFEGGVTPTGTITITDNGTYDVTDYASAVVDVPQSVTGFTEKEITEGVQIVNLSNSASYVGPYVFYSNTLQTVYLPNCTSVGENAFALCYSLQTVDMQNCTTIERQGFAYCSSLSYINIPNCISLRSEAFRNCSNLQSIDIQNVRIIYNYAFTDCSKLEFVNTDFGFIGYQTFGRCGFSEINLSNVYYIGGEAFTGCSSLTTVSLNMINYIWFSYDNMFNNCSNIESIYVQSWLYDRYVSAAGWSSFSDKFISVPVPSMLSYSDGWLTGPTKVLDYYFNSQIGCSYMSVISVSLPNCEEMLYRIGTTPPQYPLRNECRNMTYLSLGALSVATESFMKDHKKIQEVYFPICKVLKGEAFKGCSSLTTVSLPMCEYIDASVFNGCRNLQSIDLPVCSYVGPQAFFGCSSLATVSLPMCEYIDMDVFYNCPNLQSIDLPVCSYISNFAFVNAKILDTVILRSNSVCVLNGNAFQNTRIDSRYSDGFVYVPASLVDAYKSAPGWSSISSKIFPIE